MEGLNSYLEFITNIINTRGQWNPPTGYWEGHHIVPRCKGGQGSSRSKHKNVIRLTVEEHIEAHRLLAEENPDDYQLVNAYNCMCQYSKNEVSSAELQRSKELFSRLSSERWKINNPMHNSASRKKHDDYCKTEEFRSKISKTLSEYRYKNGFSKEHQSKIRQSSRIRKQKMAEQGLNFYGTKIRALDECGQNTQFATRSQAVKCFDYNDQQYYYFNSMREAAIWWHNKYPLKVGFSECVYVRKIKKSINGLQIEYKGAIIDYIKWERS